MNGASAAIAPGACACDAASPCAAATIRGAIAAIAPGACACAAGSPCNAAPNTCIACACAIIHYMYIIKLNKYYYISITINHVAINESPSARRQYFI
jgi:hypothetical protein